MCSPILRHLSIRSGTLFMNLCKARNFVRISKAQIVNLNAVRKISPDEGRKLRLLLANGETVIVSRGYVGDLKKTIGMKGDA